jgi:hypothetical protein
MSQEQEYIRREIAKLERKDKIVSAFVADHVESRPSEVQSLPLKATTSTAKNIFVSGGNRSSKSSVLARTLVWMAEESSPYWRRPVDHICNNKLCNNEDTTLLSTEEECRRGIEFYSCTKCGNKWRVWSRDVPLGFMLAGQQLKNLQENLYLPKIKRLFQDPEEWEENKLGSPYIQKITNKRTGNYIILFPHGHGEESARKIVQGYSVHAVFLDEQAPVAVLEELQLRALADYGIFMAAFTQKRKDPAMNRFIKSQVEKGIAQLFQIAQFDNPIFAHMKDALLARVASMPEGKRNAILYGEIDSDDESGLVFNVDVDALQRELPSTYTHAWRHVEIIDPAIKSIAGRLVCAQDPEKKKWYVVKAQYIRGMKHDLHLYDEIVKMRDKEGYNFVLHGCDDSANFIGVATHHPIRPTKIKTPPSKRAKGKGKQYLIDQTRYYLDYEMLYIPENFQQLWDEIYSFEWKENSEDGIKNSHRFHLIDCVMYFFDMIPDEDKEPDRIRTYTQELLDYNYAGIPMRETFKREMTLPKRKKSYMLIDGSKADKIFGKKGWRI